MKGFGKRKREAARHGKLRGIGYLDLHRGLRHCAERRRSARSAAGVGLWESAEVRVNPTGSVEVLTGCHQHGQGHETTFAQLVSERLGIPIDNVSDRARRHRQGAVRHGHLWLALRRGRHVGDRQGARQGRGQGQEGRRASCSKRPKATSSSRTASSPSPAPTSRRPGATSRSTPISRTNSPAHELEPGLKEGAFYDPTNFTFPAGCHICEVEVDPRHRQDRDRRLDRGRRFRHRDQSDDRRGPGPWRHRAGRRPGAAGRRRLRQGRPARDRLAHGLLHAARARLARRFKVGMTDDQMRRPIRSASRAAARRARSRRRRRSSTPSPTRSAPKISPCRRPPVRSGRRCRSARQPRTRSLKRITERLRCTHFTFHRPTTVRQAAGLLRASTRRPSSSPAAIR